MSPYSTSLSRIAQKFGNSNERREIFRGLISYRQELANIGFVDGFQWVSGSFTEDIERLESRHPNDVDVVTFVHRPPAVAADPDWMAFVKANLNLIDPVVVKRAFKCDVYFVDMAQDPVSIVDQSRYWFGLFSHRRGGLWKGLLQVPLAVGQDDADAAAVVA